jgi:hypothetical protein
MNNTCYNFCSLQKRMTHAARDLEDLTKRNVERKKRIEERGRTLRVTKMVET